MSSKIEALSLNKELYTHQFPQEENLSLSSLYFLFSPSCIYNFPYVSNSIRIHSKAVLKASLCESFYSFPKGGNKERKKKAWSRIRKAART